MEKLELKHLATYLPYGLNINLYCPLGNLLITNIKLGFHHLNKISQIKPILRHISDLTKEIEHNGEKFMPLNEIKNLELYSHYELEDFVRNNFNYGNIDSLSYQLINILLEWHFDVFGLIDKGLAIDINTIK